MTQNPSDKRDSKPRKCLNCGAELYPGNFCHVCGQATDTGPLTTVNMGVHILSGITRINGPFLRTCRVLLLSPWRLIAEYIHGRRVSYVAPIQMLIVLVFITLGFQFFLGGTDSGYMSRYAEFNFLSGDSVGVHGVNAVVRYLLTSMTWLYILLFIPYLPFVKLFHRLLGVRRFNNAEYIVAALYLSCFILLISLISKIPDFIFHFRSESELSVSATVLILIVLAVFSVALYKSFASSAAGTGRKIFFVFVNLVTCIVFYAFLFVAFVWIHMASFDRL